MRAIDPRMFVLGARRRIDMNMQARAAGPNPEEIERFGGQVVTDLGGTMATILCALGDKLGLFAALSSGPATSAELAVRCGLSERYVREWATGLCAAGYLDRTPATGQFEISPERAAVLADDRSPAFIAGMHQVVYELLRLLEPLEKAFRVGGGVELGLYGDGFWRGLERLTAVSFEHQLVQRWIAAAPEVEELLRRGARVADVGCGAGRAAIVLARAFPESTVHGFDLHRPNVDAARKSATLAGLEGRAAFEVRDAISGLPGTFELVTVFDVLHDSRAPLELLERIRGALAPGGACIILECKSSDRPEENRGPGATLLYGLSLMHCMTQSLAAGGEGLGACGLSEGELRRLCLEAGFSSIERLVEEPLDVLYLAR